MQFNVPPLLKIILGFLFLAAGMGYLYKPDLMLKLNKVLRETVLNDSWVALNRRSVGLLLALLGALLLYMGFDRLGPLYP
ncbi:MAG: hypothetical protein AB1734_09450 [Elusimicrobiota bacterium]|jgi:hypothetical protein